MAKWPLINTGWLPNTGCEKNGSNTISAEKSLYLVTYLKLYEQIIDTVWPFNIGQDNRDPKSCWDFANWPLIEVKITVIKGSSFRDFKTDRWIEGDSLIWCHSVQVQLYFNFQLDDAKTTLKCFLVRIFVNVLTEWKIVQIIQRHSSSSLKLKDLSWSFPKGHGNKSCNLISS